MDRSPVIHTPAYHGREDIAETGYIILDEECLNSLLMEKKTGIFTFCLINKKTGDRVYAGVREFTAKQGEVIAPWWMMEKIKVNEGDNVGIETADLPKATSVIFQPLSDDFMKISNPKVVLERSLKVHPCLTQGSIIPITFANEQYRIKVLKTEPLPQVDIRHADVVTDFAPPPKNFEHRWKEPDTDSSDEDKPITVGHRLNGKDEVIKKRHSTMASREKDLKSQRQFVGVRRFVEGQEILPPPPPEKKKKDVKKEEFIGTWHNLRKETGVNMPKVRDNGEQILKEEEEKAKKEAMFKGKPRTIGPVNK